MKNEKLTRKEIIDNRLKQADWNVTDRTQVIEEFDIHLTVVEEPTTPYAGHQYSDYVLLGKDGKPLAVVEAKKTSVDAALGREQAKRYSYIRKAKKQLAGELINTKIAGRNYQIASIRAVMEAIEKRKRRFLLVMATGTGKTRTCIALVDALMRAGWAERVLFLVDRIALRDQTLEAFKEHLPNEPRWPKQGEKEIATDRRIYVSTYPTMLNVIRHEEKSLSPHFFDLIVVDESHRSIYNTYQEILDYFKLNPRGKELKGQIPLPVRLFGVRLEKIEEAQTQSKSEIVNKEVQKIRKQVEVLPKNSVVIMEARNELQRLEDENFWNNLTFDKMEFLEAIVKPLLRTVSDVDFKAMRFEKDIVAEKEFVEFGPQHEALSVAKYRELVEKKINELVLSSQILQKLKQGQEITSDEAEQLAEELHNEHPHITIDLLRKVYNHRKAALVQFIKHILGIEQLETFAETVTKAFDDFISKPSYLTSRQLQFLDLLKNFVLEKGNVSKRNLIESPFTMLHPEGIRGIFNQKEIDEILRLTEKVLAA